MHEAWEKALATTRVIRGRVQPLATHETTRLPYIYLSESSVNRGDTVVRRGEVLVERPSIVLPSGIPQFEGFDFEEKMGLNEDFLKTFFLVRGVSFPSMKYRNLCSLEVFEGTLAAAIERHSAELARAENTATGLVAGRDDLWPLGVLIFVAGQAIRSAPGDLRRLSDDYRANLS
jgi:hypothetical protein